MKRVGQYGSDATIEICNCSIDLMLIYISFFYFFGPELIWVIRVCLSLLDIVNDCVLSALVQCDGSNLLLQPLCLYLHFISRPGCCTQCNGGLVWLASRCKAMELRDVYLLCVYPWTNAKLWVVPFGNGRTSTDCVSFGLAIVFPAG